MLLRLMLYCINIVHFNIKYSKYTQRYVQIEKLCVRDYAVGNMPLKAEIMTLFNFYFVLVYSV